MEEAWRHFLLGTKIFVGIIQTNQTRWNTPTNLDHGAAKIEPRIASRMKCSILISSNRFGRLGIFPQYIAYLFQRLDFGIGNICHLSVFVH